MCVNRRGGGGGYNYFVVELRAIKFPFFFFSEGHYYVGNLTVFYCGAQTNCNRVVPFTYLLPFRQHEIWPLPVEVDSWVSAG